MKLNRFFALAAIALLVVGAMGAIAARTFAQTPIPHAQEVQATEATDSQMSANGPDGDNVDEQVGDQTSADTGAEVNGGAQTESGDGQDAAPSGTPAITAEAAQKTAEAYLNAGAASKVQLDDENGKLIYSVEIGGNDVKVDAMTGEVLGVDTGQD